MRHKVVDVIAQAREYLEEMGWNHVSSSLGKHYTWLRLELEGCRRVVEVAKECDEEWYDETLREELLQYAPEVAKLHDALVELENEEA